MGYNMCVQYIYIYIQYEFFYYIHINIRILITKGPVIPHAKINQPRNQFFTTLKSKGSREWDATLNICRNPQGETTLSNSTIYITPQISHGNPCFCVFFSKIAYSRLGEHS